MSQERLSNLGILFIENQVTEKIYFEDYIDEFEIIKSRKIPNCNSEELNIKKYYFVILF